MLSRSRQGMSLLEVALAAVVLFLTLAVVAGVSQKRLQRARMEQTAQDMSAIAEAVLNYNSATGSWPSAVADLAPAYLPAPVVQNAFGYSYSLACSTGKVSVSSQVPAGLAQNASLGSLWEVSSAGGGYEKVTVTKREEIGSLGRLKYDKKYLYNE